MMARKQKKVFHLVDLFRFKSLRTLTLLMIVIDSTLDMIFFAPSLMIAQFNFNIYINGVVVFSSQVIAGVFSTYIVTKFKRKTIAIVNFVLVLACSTTLIFIWDQSQTTVSSVSSDIAVLVFLFVMEFCLTI